MCYDAMHVLVCQYNDAFYMCVFFSSYLQHAVLVKI